MKLKNYLLLATLFFFGCNIIFAQLVRPFTPRLTGGSIEVKGDIELIGNTILTPVGQALPFNGPGNNNNFVVQYLDVDSNPATVNSSSANLFINQTCKRIVYAGLYWSAFYPNATNTDTGSFYDNTNRRSDWNQVKFSAKGAPYVTLTADENPDAVGDEDNILAEVKYNNNNTETVYACYKNITSILQGLADADGTYTVADLRATTGNRRGGCAGGWTMVVVYESPQLPSKNIAVFDGFGFVNVDPAPAQLLNLNIPVSGFKTVPAPLTVNAKIGIGALDGDFSSTGDGLSFKSGPLASPGVFTNISDVLNPANNFFNSTISRFGNQVTNRNPTNTNTIGLDIDHVILNNPANSVLPNGATEGTLKISTTGDGYGVFLSTFAVDILAPKIVLSKKVINSGGADITGQTVGRGAFLRYIIGFENKGSDKGKDVTITDYLPKNIKFNYPGDISPLPAGVTILSYDPLDPLGRKIVFKVSDNLVDLLNDQERFIEFKVEILTECKDFDDACSNLIENTAYTRYTGVENKDIFDDSSQPPSVGCVFGLRATNFLANIDGCTFEKSYELCGASVDISAADGYQNYVWTLPGGGTATGQTINVKATGTYLVHGDPKAPCIKSIDETITVNLFTNAVTTNPISVYATNIKPDGSDRGEITECPGNKKLLPQLFLCGANDKRLLEITNASVLSTEWYRLDGTAACITKALNNGAPILCANEDAGCAWTKLVTTGKTYLADTQGNYKVKLNYAGGCFNEFYFNVFKNPLNPTATSKNIFCTTPGSMTVGGIPLDGTYEFSFTTTGSPGTWVSGPNSEVFTTTTPGLYTAYIRLINPKGGCVFTVTKQIDPSNFRIKTELTQPTCTKPLGDIKVTAENGNPLKDYTYTLTKTGVPGSTIIGPIAISNYTFQNQGSGTYSVRVTTPDGCDLSETVILNPIVKLDPTATLTIPLTCKPGEITVNANGGTAPYSYFVNINGAIATTFQTDPKIVIPLGSEGKSYVIRVVDINNCEANTPAIVIPANPKPTFDIKTTPAKCYSDPGKIEFINIVNPANYTLEFSVNGGSDYQTLPTFTLPAGDYQVRIRYSLSDSAGNKIACETDPVKATIAGPASALTASAGVAELAGCGVGGTGKIRITNPQGGKPITVLNPYLYSFDNQGTWITSNEMYKAPGTYTVYIKDANDCIFAMKVTIDPEPLDPIIDVITPVDFNCNGSATSTVTINNPGPANFTYNYYLDNVLNTNVPSYTFLNVASGNHTVKVEYNLVNSTTFSNLLEENFGSGPPTITKGIADATTNPPFPGYCFNDQRVNSPYLCGTRSVEDGQYSVASFFWRSDDTSASPAWFHFKDHTTNAVDPNGRYLLVNIGGAAGPNGILYSKPIVDVIPNQKVKVSLYVGNLLRKGIGGANPNFRFQLVNPAGVVVSELDSGEIGITSADRERWLPINIELDPKNNTNLTFRIRSASILYGGNDAVIDDINVYQLPISCLKSKEITVIVPTGKAFVATASVSKNASCAGVKDGEITITATNFDPVYGFDYNIGAGWVNSKVSPIKIPGLAGGGTAYTPQVRYNSAGLCTLTLNKLTISQPLPLVVDATATPATCSSGSIVTATSTGGTPAVTYTLTNIVSPFTVTAFPANGILNNVAPGTYKVEGTDANLCKAAKATNLVIVAPGSLTASVNQGASLCFDPITGATMTVTIVGGVSPYSYETKIGAGAYSVPSPAFSGSTFTYNATTPGTYEFRVTDKYGCIAITPSQVINAKLTANAVTKNELTCKPTLPIPGPDALIETTISGGTGPYTYSIKNSGGTTVFTSPAPISGLVFTYQTATSSTYTFTITDKNGCVTTATAIVNPKVAVTGTVTVTDATCFGANDGSVTLASGTGVGTFTYSFNGSAFSSTTIYSGLPGSLAGIAYPYVIKDSNECVFNGTATVKQPASITGTATITTPYTCLGGAVITVSGVTGGNGVYNYTLNNGGSPVAGPQIAVTFSNITTSGNYTVTIKDGKNCTFTTTPVIPIVALNPPTTMNISNTALKCPSNLVDVTINSVTGGFGALQYQIIAPLASATAYQSGKTFTNLAPGTYTFQVKDANSCVYPQSYTIKPLDPIAVTSVLVKDVDCLGSSTGAVNYTISGLGNNVNYSYQIDGGTAVTGTTPATGVTTFVVNAIALNASNHTLVITDLSTNCSGTGSKIVSGPALALAITLPTITAITCTKGATIVINTTGGWGGNTYTVTPIAPAGPAIVQVGVTTFNNLTAGTYTASVTDSKGCTKSIGFTILPLVTVVASIDPTSDFCYDSTNQATIKVTPNTFTNYVYSINGGTPQANGTFANLVPGNYVIRVTDTSTQCFIDLPSQTINRQVTASTAVTKELDCSVTPNAIIQVTIANGYPPYEYQVKLGTGVYTTYTTTGTPFTYSAAVTGTYTFQVKDSKGCENTVIQVINPITNPTITATPTNPSCNAGTDGTVKLNPLAGSGGYTYSITAPLAAIGNISGISTGIFTGLSANINYTFQVKDSKNCVGTVTQTLTNPPGLTAVTNTPKLSCGAGNVTQPAVITVTASNGTPFAGPNPYFYSYDAGSTYITSNTYSVSTAGTVTIFVKDAQNCVFGPIAVPIVALNPPTAIAFAQVNPITCAANTTNVKLTVTNGVAPLNYEILTPVAVNNGASDTFLNLASNTYTFKVTDANGCSFTDLYEVKPVVPITAGVSSFTNVSCNAGANGTITFNVGGNSTGFTYILKNSANVTIPIVQSTATPTIVTYTGLVQGTYTLTVTNPTTGCSATASQIITQPTAISITGFTASKVFCSKPLSSIVITATGGTASLKYALVKQPSVAPALATFTASNTFTKDTAIDGLLYDAYVSDGNSCTPIKATLTVVSDPLPTNTSAPAPVCFTGASFPITLSAGPGAFGILTYGINGSYQPTATYTVTTPGTYVLTIKDGNGCISAPVNYVVNPQLKLVATLDKDQTCSLPANAIISLSATGGTGAGTYTYEYSTNGGGSYSPMIPSNSTTLTVPITALASINYVFRVTDSKLPSGCTAISNVITVTQPILPDVTGFTITNPIKCSGSSTAAITINYDNTKGLPPFVFNVQKTNAPTFNYGTRTSGLPAGDYRITITDAKGCTDFVNQTITEPDPITVNYRVIDIACVAAGVSKGSIIIDNVTGGSPNYNYYVTGSGGYNQSELNTGGVASVTFNVVDFGLYQINVVDQYGCTKLIQDILVASPPNQLGITVTPSPPGDCTTKPKANVAVSSAFAGVGPFFFSIYQGPASLYPNPPGSWFAEDTPGSKQHEFTNLIPGVKYFFLVYDAVSQCQYFETGTAAISTNSTLTASAPKVNNVTCTGSTDGKVSFDITSTYGVSTPVIYEVYDALTSSPIIPSVTGSGNVPPNGTLSVTNLGPLPVGNYFVLVKEDVGATNAGCSITTSKFDITQSTLLLSVTATVTKNSNTCNLNAGVITAEAKDGTSPYLYKIFPDLGAVGAIDGADPVTTDLTFSATFSSPVDTPNTFNKSAGSYIVYAKDAYGCIKADFVTLIDDIAPSIMPLTPQCYTGTPIIVPVVASVFAGSTTNYAIGTGVPGVAVAGAYSPNANVVFPGPGSYTIFVKDDNGCIDEEPYIIRDEIKVELKINKILTCTAASIDGVITGGTGTGTYFYSVKIGSGAFSALTPVVGTTFTYPATTTDTYTFAITDGSTAPACSGTNFIIVNPENPALFTTPKVDVDCKGSSTGRITVDVTSGEGPYEYKLDRTTPVLPAYSRAYQSASNVFDLLPQGTYTVTVRDKYLCEYPSLLPITIGEPALALALDTPTIIGLSCGLGNVPQAATVTLNVTAGTGTAPYEYSFNGGSYSSVNTFPVNDTGATQTINYIVKDKNGCIIPSSVIINPLDPPKIVSVVPSPILCLPVASTTSTAVITITNGVGTPTYTILSGSTINLPTATSATGATFTGLTAGDYVFEVKDTNGCTDKKAITIAPVTKIDLQLQSQNNVTCKLDTDGKATFSVIGFGTGVGTYSYTANTTPAISLAGQTAATISLTGLGAGTYTVVVTDDATGCTDTDSVTITEPSIALSSSNTVIPLGCITKGAVTINAVGGWGNNVYTLTQPDTTVLTNNNGIFGGLTLLGLYNTSVKDSNGCEKLDNFNLILPVNPTATIDVTSDYCYDGINKATLVITAASTSTFTVTPFMYSINNGINFQLSNTFSNLDPGSYNIVVKDDFGCTSTPFNEIIKPQLFAQAIKTKDLDCSVAPLSPNGTIRITPTGGYGSYTYGFSITGGAPYAPIPATNPAFTDYTVTTAGSYTFLITDAKNCSYFTTPPVIMTAPTAVDFIVSDVAVINPDCSGTQGVNNNGTITVNLRVATNNNPDYTYTLTPVAPLPVVVVGPQSSNLFTGLAPGTYNITVTSGRKCFKTVQVTVGIPPVVTASASASPFKCSATNRINTTVVTVTAGGGTGVGTYTYSADGINYFASNTFDVIDNATVQNLNFYVKDGKGCVATAPISINAFPKLISAIVTPGPAIDCINNKQVLNIVINGGSILPNPFTYEVYKDGILFAPSQTVAGISFSYDALTPGSFYTFKITDNNTLCTITSDPYTVPLFNTINVVASESFPVSCFGGNDGKILIAVSGYTGAYNYRILDSTATQVGVTGTGNTTTNPLVLTTGLPIGNYTVEVTETAYPQCVKLSNVVTITGPGAKTDIILISNVNKNCKTTGAVVTVAGKDGVPGYTYAFVLNGVTPLVGDYSVLATKTLPTTQIAPATDSWDVWVKDSKDCTAFITVPITTDPIPTIDVTASQCASPTGYTIDVEVLSGVGLPYEYSIGSGFVADPTTKHTFNVTAPGDYTVTVRDKNGCDATTNTKIIDPLGLQAELTTVPTCTLADGVITVKASSGSGNYEYSKDNVTYGPSPVFNGLAPSATPYTFYVRDITTLCVTPVNKAIELPTLVTGITLNPTGVTCFGGTDGSITVTLAPSNDNPEYTYSLAGTTVTGNPVTRASQTQNLFDNLEAGSYTISVLSGRKCPASTSIDVGQPALITVPAPTVQQFGCNFNTNDTNPATITVLGVNGGSNVYEKYEFIRNGVQVQFESSNVYIENDMTGATYLVNVYDDKGCKGSAVLPIIIKPFVDLDKITVRVDQVITCTNLEDITVTVKSKNGTLLTAPSTNLIYTVVDNDASTGIEGANYSQSNTTGVFTGLTLSATGISGYIITVLNVDTQCSIKDVYFVKNPNTFELKIDNKKDLICFTDTNGSIDVSINDLFITATDIDNSGPFDYTIVDNNNPLNIIPGGSIATAGPITIGNLPRGQYTITAILSKTPFCSVTNGFTIDGPDAILEINEVHSKITCTPGADGEIIATASGGWAGGYVYKLDGTATVAYSANSEFKGLLAGTYTVTVRDSGGCEVSENITLDPPTSIAIDAVADKTVVNCVNEKSATITATVTAGNSGYLYTLNTTSVTPPTTDGPYNSGIFQNLGKGTYTVTVTDKLGCDATSNTVTIDEPIEVVAELSLEKGATCLTGGSVRLLAKGGRPPYTYSPDGSVYSTITFTTDIVINAPVRATPYHYYVKDALGCESEISRDVPVLAPEELILKIDDSNAKILCRGSFTGVIVAEAKGGLGNYNYIMVDALGVALTTQPEQLTPGRFTKLGVGDYYVKVVSGDCEKTSPLIPIREPDFAIGARAIPTNVTCNGDGNGMITVEILSQGTGVIKYAITRQDEIPYRLDQFFDKGVFTGLKVGLYDLIAQDENGCFVPMLGIPITEPDPLLVDIIPTSIVQEKCYGDKNAKFRIKIEGGTPPYTVTLDQDPTTTIIGTLMQDEFEFASIAGGEHNLLIIDANKCEIELPVSLDVAIDIAPEVTVDYGCPTIADPLINTVIVTVNPDLIAGDVTYMLDGVPYVATNVYLSNGGIFQNVPVGKHKILVKHKDGCEQLTLEFEILQIDPLSVLLTQGGLNEIVATPTGGAGGNTFTFNGESTGSNNKYIYYSSGNYTVVVTDDNGCQATDTKPFEYIDIEVPEIFTPNGDGNNDGWRPNKTENYPDLIYYIFDRYGRKLGTFSQPESWDGRYDGKELPTGDYWYALKLRNVKDEREFVGHFMLYR
jgi:large repetitive protein